LSDNVVVSTKASLWFSFPIFFKRSFQVIEQSQKVEKPASNFHFLLTQLIIRPAHNEKWATKMGDIDVTL